MKVLIVGLWHQGVVASACLADWGYEVVGIDSDDRKIQNLNLAKAPLFEPGLDDLLASGLENGRLIFSKGSSEEIRGARVILIAHDTPVDENDISDLGEVFQSIKYLIPHVSDGVIFHVTAQVPVGTCEQFIDLIKVSRPNLKFSIAYSPENLRLGQAINLYRTPMLPVIGVNDGETFELLKEFYSFMSADWQCCSIKTAEMLKHALNTFLALSITFANELGNLCDKLGADGHRLANLLRLEPRVGSKAMLMPGLGFSGGTLARDVQTLKRFGAEVGIETALLDGLWIANQRQNKLVANRVVEYFDGSLKGINICVLGLTYKPDTSTLRRSAALELIGDLARSGAHVKASDPMADRDELMEYKNFEFCESFADALVDADALVLVTPWVEYKKLDFRDVYAKMRGRLVFDAGNLWRESDVALAGLQYVNIGGGKLIGGGA